MLLDWAMLEDYEHPWNVDNYRWDFSYLDKVQIIAIQAWHRCRTRHFTDVLQQETTPQDIWSMFTVKDYWRWFRFGAASDNERREEREHPKSEHVNAIRTLRRSERLSSINPTQVEDPVADPVNDAIAYAPFPAHPNPYADDPAEDSDWLDTDDEWPESMMV
jgi:hypothetical protein